MFHRLFFMLRSMHIFPIDNRGYMKSVRVVSLGVIRESGSNSHMRDNESFH